MNSPQVVARILGWLQRASGLQAFTLSFVLLATVFPLLGFTRFIDGDEGYYLLAARLVGEAHTLYSDFLYTQMPLLPYAYSFWFTLFGVSWLSARGLAIVLAISIGLLLFHSLLNARHSPQFALLGVVLYSSSSLAFGWLTVAKTYGLSTVLLLASYVALRHLPRVPLPYSCLLSGLLFGCAVNSRLLVAVVLPAFLLSLSDRTGNPPTVRVSSLFLWYIGGCAVALVPALYLLVTSSSAFLFGNVGYHSIRTDLPLPEALSQKLAVALSLLGINTADGVVSLQFKILLLFNVLYAIQKWCRERLDAAFYVGAALCLINFAPTPSFVQYFAVPLPFLIIIAVLWLHDGSSTVRGRCFHEILGGGRLVSWALLAAYVIVAPIDIYRYSVSGRDMPGMEGKADRLDWRISTVRAVSGELDAFAREGLAVVSWWPGYFVESSARILPGLENHFGVTVAGKLDPERRRQYRVLSPAELVLELEQGRHPVVLGNWVPDRVATRKDLLRMGYEVHSQVGRTEIYVRRASSRQP